MRKRTDALRSVAWAAAILAATGPGAFAGDPPAHFLTMPDDFVRAAVALARDNLPGQTLPDGDPIAAESDAERARPLIPFADARSVVNAGAASGFADWCGVEWRSRSFQPLMLRHRDAGDVAPKALTFIALLHGVAKGLVRRDMDRVGACGPEDRAAVDDYLNRVAGR